LFPQQKLMGKCLVLGAIALLAGVGTYASPAAAAVVVVGNRTAGKIEFTILRADNQERQSLAAGDLMPIPTIGPVGLAFSAGKAKRYLLQPNCVYYFLNGDEGIDLRQMFLEAGGEKNPATAKPLPNRPGPAPPASASAVYTIPVKILADDHEPRVQEVWEKRIRHRLAEASDIFEHYCRVRFQVVAVGSWSSNEKNFMFDKALTDFEQKVRPAPARLAIGFTGRYQWLPGEKHAGGTRSPLHPYILIRESFPGAGEAERLEFLVHEMGHYLGAVHTPDVNSVMRPVLGDRRARAVSFRIGFDGPNTLIMNLIVENLRTRPAANLFQLSPETKVPLATAYAFYARAMPKDPGMTTNLALLGFNVVRPRGGQNAATGGVPAPVTPDSKGQPGSGDKQVRP
jgi:hypothetical protein